MKTVLLTAAVLASGQAMAAPYSITYITNSAKTSANGENPDGLRDQVTLRGDTAGQDFSSVLYTHASDAGAAARVEASLISHFDGRYTGTVSATCQRKFDRPLDGRHNGHLSCYGRWEHKIRNTGSGTISVAMNGSSDKSSAANDAWRVAYLGANLSVNGAEDDVVRHTNGEFDEGKSSIFVPAHPESNSIMFSYGNSTSGGIPAQTQDAQFSFRWTIDAGSYRLNAESDSDSLPGAEQVIDGSNTVYQVEGRKKVTSDFLPVDITKNYQLSGRFKSLDDDLSFVYFGIESYDENLQLIESYMVNRFGRDHRVSSVNAEEIIVAGNVDDWAASDAPAHQRAIGIYLDGDTSKRPDHYVMYDLDQTYSTDPSAGAYGHVDGGKISLNHALPAEIMDAIVPGVSVVKNHRQSSTHIYLLGADVAQQWTQVEGQLSGVAWINRHDAFRPQTRYVKIYVAGNWQGGVTEALLFDDLLLEQSQ